MPPTVVFLKSRALAAIWMAERPAVPARLMLASVHLVAFIIMAWSEFGLAAMAAFALTWGLVNFGWLVVLRRPVLSGALSLALFVVLILLSRFKHDILLMTVNFVDVMIVDADTTAFLLTVFPNLTWAAGAAAIVVVPSLVLLWWADPLRVRRRTAALAGTACVAGLAALAWAVPGDPQEEFNSENYVSKFARSGVTALADLSTRGLMESDATAPDRLRGAAGQTRYSPSATPACCRSRSTGHSGTRRRTPALAARAD